jgi:DNA-binding MarR family transcriptional regulator
MNKTVVLLNEWAAFESAHPHGDLADFCRHFLARVQHNRIGGPLVGGVVPPGTDGLLLKLMGRISKLNRHYAASAFEDTGLNQMEEFGILSAIQLQHSPRKTDVINNNLFKLTSGTNMIDRLRDRGLITEYDDEEDKRSKRLELTAAGLEAVEAARRRMMKVSKMMLHALTEDDKVLCIALLKNIEIKHSALWLTHKARSFDEVYEEIMR